MKKITFFLPLAFLLTSCFSDQNSTDTKPIPASDKQPVQTSDKGNTSPTQSWTNTSTWTGLSSSWSDKAADQTLKEIDDMINDIATEK